VAGVSAPLPPGPDARIELADPQAQLLAEIADVAMKRADVAMTYRLAIRASRGPGGATVDWRKVNEAIIERWSASGLTWIKRAAWDAP
jgi:hypothetical protein